MAPTKISFNDHNATPPVYVAGSFTEWQAVELSASGEAGYYTYEKTFDLTPGEYHFKFRLGPGDWWVCDNETGKARDDAGNENNVLVVKPEPVKAAPKPVQPATEPAKAASIPTPAPTPAPAPAPEPAVVPTVVSNVVDSKPEPAAPVSQHFHNLVTSASPVTQPAKSVEVSETPKPEIAPLPKVDQVEQAPEVPKLTEKPVQMPVNGTAIPPAAAKDVDSKGTSVSSLPPKAKKSGDAEPEQQKLGWFARLFLCGSSGKVLLAAVVVGVPVLWAYVIQK